MQPQQVLKSTSLYDLNYPIYVSPIPIGVKILHIPGQFEYKHLDNVYSYVAEAYKTDDRIYIFDVIPLNLWQKKVCKINYETRLKYVRKVVYDQIGKPEEVLDLETVLIDNPAELTDYFDNLLSQAYKSVMIHDVNGHYVFGRATNGELLEMEL